MSQKVADVMYSQSNKLGMFLVMPNVVDSTVLILKTILGISGDFSHGFTYSAHPFSCAIAIEALKTYK